MTDEEKVWILTNMRYDGETGVLERWVTHNGKNELKAPYWKTCSDKPNSSGYSLVNVLGELLGAHRVAWLLAHGSIDDELSIDHINGERNDNRLCNLRLGTTRENMQNRSEHRDGHLCGTTWHKRYEKWMAQIQINGKNKYLGYFSTEIEAHEAYNQAVKALAN
jgi:hypothetical protein